MLGANLKRSGFHTHCKLKKYRIASHRTALRNGDRFERPSKKEIGENRRTFRLLFRNLRTIASGSGANLI